MTTPTGTFNPWRPISIGLAHMGVGAVSGYIGARLFSTALSPLGGGLFGAIYGVTRLVTERVFAKLNGEERLPQDQRLQSWIWSVITSAVATNLALAAITGISLTSGATIGMVLSLVVGSIILELAIKAVKAAKEVFNESASNPQS
jgi:Co/Zn/Cd efflux system component